MKETLEEETVVHEETLSTTVDETIQEKPAICKSLEEYTKFENEIRTDQISYLETHASDSDKDQPECNVFKDLNESNNTENRIETMKENLEEETVVHEETLSTTVDETIQEKPVICKTLEEYTKFENDIQNDEISYLKTRASDSDKDQGACNSFKDMNESNSTENREEAMKENLEKENVVYEETLSTTVDETIQEKPAICKSLEEYTRFENEILTNQISNLQTHASDSGKNQVECNIFKDRIEINNTKNRKDTIEENSDNENVVHEEVLSTTTDVYETMQEKPTIYKPSHQLGEFENEVLINQISNLETYASDSEKNQGECNVSKNLNEINNTKNRKEIMKEYLDNKFVVHEEILSTTTDVYETMQEKHAMCKSLEKYTNHHVVTEEQPAETETGNSSRETPVFNSDYKDYYLYNPESVDQNYSKSSRYEEEKPEIELSSQSEIVSDWNIQKEEVVETVQTNKMLILALAAEIKRKSDESNEKIKPNDSMALKKTAKLKMKTSFVKPTKVTKNAQLKNTRKSRAMEEITEVEEKRITRSASKNLLEHNKDNTSDNTPSLFGTVLKPQDFKTTSPTKNVKVHQLLDSNTYKDTTDSDSNDSECSKLFIDDIKIEDHTLNSIFNDDTMEENLKFCYEPRIQCTADSTNFKNVGTLLRRSQKPKTKAEIKLPNPYIAVERLSANSFEKRAKHKNHDNGKIENKSSENLKLLNDIHRQENNREKQHKSPKKNKSKNLNKTAKSDSLNISHKSRKNLNKPNENTTLNTNGIQKQDPSEIENESNLKSSVKNADTENISDVRKEIISQGYNNNKMKEIDEAKWESFIKGVDISKTKTANTTSEETKDIQKEETKDIQKTNHTSIDDSAAFQTEIELVGTNDSEQPPNLKKTEEYILEEKNKVKEPSKSRNKTDKLNSSRPESSFMTIEENNSDISTKDEGTKTEFKNSDKKPASNSKSPVAINSKHNGLNNASLSPELETKISDENKIRNDINQVKIDCSDSGKKKYNKNKFVTKNAGVDTPLNLKSKTTDPKDVTIGILPKKLHYKYKNMNKSIPKTGEKEGIASTVTKIDNESAPETMNITAISKEKIISSYEDRKYTTPPKLRNKRVNSTCIEPVTIDLSKCKNTVKNTTEKLEKRLENEIQNPHTNENSVTSVTQYLDKDYCAVNKFMDPEDIPLNLRLKHLGTNLGIQTYDNADTYQAIDLGKIDSSRLSKNECIEVFVEKTTHLAKQDITDIKEQDSINTDKEMKILPSQKKIKVLSDIIIVPEKEPKACATIHVTAETNAFVEIKEDNLNLTGTSNYTLDESAIEKAEMNESRKYTSPNKQSFMYEGEEIDKLIQKYTKDEREEKSRTRRKSETYTQYKKERFSGSKKHIERTTSTPTNNPNSVSSGISSRCLRSFRSKSFAAETQTSDDHSSDKTLRSRSLSIRGVKSDDSTDIIKTELPFEDKCSDHHKERTKYKKSKRTRFAGIDANVIKNSSKMFSNKPQKMKKPKKPRKKIVSEYNCNVEDKKELKEGGNIRSEHEKSTALIVETSTEVPELTKADKDEGTEVLSANSVNMVEVDTNFLSKMQCEESVEETSLVIPESSVSVVTFNIDSDIIPSEVEMEIKPDVNQQTVNLSDSEVPEGMWTQNGESANECNNNMNNSLLATVPSNQRDNEITQSNSISDDIDLKTSVIKMELTEKYTKNDNQTSLPLDSVTIEEAAINDNEVITRKANTDLSSDNYSSALLDSKSSQMPTLSEEIKCEVAKVVLESATEIEVKNEQKIITTKNINDTESIVTLVSDKTHVKEIDISKNERNSSLSTSSITCESDENKSCKEAVSSDNEGIKSDDQVIGTENPSIVTESETVETFGQDNGSVIGICLELNSEPGAKELHELPIAEKKEGSMSDNITTILDVENEQNSVKLKYASPTKSCKLKTSDLIKSLRGQKKNRRSKRKSKKLNVVRASECSEAKESENTFTSSFGSIHDNNKISEQLTCEDKGQAPMDATNVNPILPTENEELIDDEVLSHISSKVGESVKTTLDNFADTKNEELVNDIILPTDSLKSEEISNSEDSKKDFVVETLLPAEKEEIINTTDLSTPIRDNELLNAISESPLPENKLDDSIPTIENEEPSNDPIDSNVSSKDQEFLNSAVGKVLEDDSMGASESVELEELSNSIVPNDSLTSEEIIETMLDNDTDVLVETSEELELISETVIVPNEESVDTILDSTVTTSEIKQRSLTTVNEELDENISLGSSTVGEKRDKNISIESSSNNALEDKSYRIERSELATDITLTSTEIKSPADETNSVINLVESQFPTENKQFANEDELLIQLDTEINKITASQSQTNTSVLEESKISTKTRDVEEIPAEKWTEGSTTLCNDHEYLKDPMEEPTDNKFFSNQIVDHNLSKNGERSPTPSKENTDSLMYSNQLVDIKNPLINSSKPEINTEQINKVLDAVTLLQSNKPERIGVQLLDDQKRNQNSSSNSDIVESFDLSNYDQAFIQQIGDLLKKHEMKISQDLKESSNTNVKKNQNAPHQDMKEGMDISSERNASTPSDSPFDSEIKNMDTKINKKRKLIPSGKNEPLCKKCKSNTIAEESQPISSSSCVLDSHKKRQNKRIESVVNQLKETNSEILNVPYGEKIIFGEEVGQSLQNQRQCNPPLQRVSNSLLLKNKNLPDTIYHAATEETVEFPDAMTLIDTSNAELDLDMLPSDITDFFKSFFVEKSPNPKTYPNSNMNVNSMNWIPSDLGQQFGQSTCNSRPRPQAISIVSSHTFSATITNNGRTENNMFSPEDIKNGGFARITSKKEITFNFNNHYNQNTRDPVLNFHGISTNEYSAMEHYYPQALQRAGQSETQLKAITDGTNDHNYSFNTRDPVMSIAGYGGDNMSLNAKEFENIICSMDPILDLDLPEDDENSIRREPYTTWDNEPKVIVVPNEQYPDDIELKEFETSSVISEAIDDTLVTEPWASTESVKNTEVTSTNYNTPDCGLQEFETPSAICESVVSEPWIATDLIKTEAVPDSNLKEFQTPTAISNVESWPTADSLNTTAVEIQNEEANINLLSSFLKDPDETSTRVTQVIPENLVSKPWVNTASAINNQVGIPFAKGNSTQNADKQEQFNTPDLGDTLMTDSWGESDSKATADHDNKNGINSHTNNNLLSGPWSQINGTEVEISLNDEGANLSFQTTSYPDVPIAPNLNKMHSVTAEDIEDCAASESWDILEPVISSVEEVSSTKTEDTNMSTGSDSGGGEIGGSKRIKQLLDLHKKIQTNNQTDTQTKRRHANIFIPNRKYSKTSPGKWTRSSGTCLPANNVTSQGSIEKVTTKETDSTSNPMNITKMKSETINNEEYKVKKSTENSVDQTSLLVDSQKSLRQIKVAPDSKEISNMTSLQLKRKKSPQDTNSSEESSNKKYTYVETNRTRPITSTNKIPDKDISKKTALTANLLNSSLNENVKKEPIKLDTDHSKEINESETSKRKGTVENRNMAASKSNQLDTKAEKSSETILSVKPKSTELAQRLEGNSLKKMEAQNSLKDSGIPKESLFENIDSPQTSSPGTSPYESSEAPSNVFDFVKSRTRKPTKLYSTENVRDSSKTFNSDYKSHRLKRKKTPDIQKPYENKPFYPPLKEGERLSSSQLENLKLKIKLGGSTTEYKHAVSSGTEYNKHSKSYSSQSQNYSSSRSSNYSIDKLLNTSRDSSYERSSVKDSKKSLESQKRPLYGGLNSKRKSEKIEYRSNEDTFDQLRSQGNINPYFKYPESDTSSGSKNPRYEYSSLHSTHKRSSSGDLGYNSKRRPSEDSSYWKSDRGSVRSSQRYSSSRTITESSRMHQESRSSNEYMKYPHPSFRERENSHFSRKSGSSRAQPTGSHSNHSSGHSSSAELHKKTDESPSDSNHIYFNKPSLSEARKNQLLEDLKQCVQIQLSKSTKRKSNTDWSQPIGSILSETNSALGINRRD